MKFKVTHVRGYNKTHFNKTGNVKGGKKFIKVISGRDWVSAAKKSRFGVITNVRQLPVRRKKR